MSRVGLDVDGVIYNYDKTVRYMLRTMRGHQDNPALLNEATSWTSTQNAVSKHDWQWVWSKGVKLGLFRYGHLYSGAIEGIRAISQLADVIIITHRPENAVQDTLDWLSYLHLPFKEVYLLTKGQAKSSVPQCGFYVDDKPENVVDFQENTGGYPILWSRPWNSYFDIYGRMTRVSSWEQVVAAIRN